MAVGMICPSTETCKFYQAWSKQTEANNVDVIHQNGDYHCIALDIFIKKGNRLQCYYPESLNIVRNLSQLESDKLK